MAKSAKILVSKKRERALAWRALLGVNFFIETNRLEPYVAVYMIEFKKWDKVQIGYISVVMNLLMLVLQTPAGELLDRTHRKKTITAMATLVAAVTTTMVVWTDNFWAVLFAKALEGAAATIFLPGLMSLLLGVVPKERIPKVVADCEVSNKVGSMFFALFCGLISFYFYPDVAGMFYLLGAGGIAAALFIFLIPGSSIDHSNARNMARASSMLSRSSSMKSFHSAIERGKEEDGDEKSNGEFMTGHDTEKEGKEKKKKKKPMRHRDLLRDRNIRMLALLTFVYHLANAAVLPLVAQYVSIDNQKEALAFTSATLLVAFMVQAVTSYIVGKYATKMNYKFWLLIAHLVLPIRCTILAILVATWDNRYAMTATQIFDGIGAGLYDTMIPIVVTKMTAGTGRFGFTYAFIVTCWRVGHGFSVLLAEAIAQGSGYEAAFISQGAIGLVAAMILFCGVTLPSESQNKKPPSSDSENSSKDDDFDGVVDIQVS